MIGLSLAGGGVKGSYQIGAYYAFKKCHIKIDGITGTSIGAFNGAMIAAHKEKELLEFWQNPDVSEILGIDQKIKDKISLKQFDKELLELTHKELKKFIKNEGIPIDGLKKILSEYNLEESVRNSDIEFGLSTLRLKDNKPLDLFIGDMKKGSLNNYILSSCYLPIFKREKLENDSYYFDGGIYNYAPYNMLLKKEYDLVYSIELKAIGLKQIPLDASKVVIISPSRKLSKMITLNNNAILNNIKIGYYDAIKVLKKYDGYKYIFKQKKDSYFKRLNSRVDKDTYNLIKGFTYAKNDKEMVIKALEYLMKKEEETYFNIYSLPKMLKKYRNKDSNSIVTRYLKALKMTIF